jgi:hypothetical protein
MCFVDNGRSALIITVPARYVRPWLLVKRHYNNSACLLLPVMKSVTMWMAYSIAIKPTEC